MYFMPGSGLFAYLARAPFHFINSHAPTLNLPPTPTIARFFFTNDLFGPLYLGIIGSKKLLFIIDLASHRIVSFPFHCELNCPRHLAGHCLSIIMLSVICYPLKHLQFHSRTKQPKGPSQRGVFSVGLQLFEL